MSAEHALAIANLKALYCATADRAAHDPEGARVAFQSVFLGDVVADYGYGLVSGVASVSEFLCTAIAGNSLWMQHMLHSPRIHVDGDCATGDWTVAIHSKRREDDRIDDIYGRYSDSFQITADGWRIAKVTFRHLA